MLQSEVSDSPTCCLQHAAGPVYSSRQEYWSGCQNVTPASSPEKIPTMDSEYQGPPLLRNVSLTRMFVVLLHFALWALNVDVC